MNRNLHVCSSNCSPLRNADDLHFKFSEQLRRHLSQNSSVWQPSNDIQENAMLEPKKTKQKKNTRRRRRQKTRHTSFTHNTGATFKINDWCCIRPPPPPLPPPWAPILDFRGFPHFYSVCLAKQPQVSATYVTECCGSEHKPRCNTTEEKKIPQQNKPVGFFW